MYDAEKFLETFGPTLARMRKEKGMSQFDMCEEAGLSRPPASYWETGRRLPTLYSFLCILNALGMTADEMLKECEVDE